MTPPNVCATNTASCWTGSPTDSSTCPHPNSTVVQHLPRPAQRGDLPETAHPDPRSARAARSGQSRRQCDRPPQARCRRTYRQINAGHRPNGAGHPQVAPPIFVTVTVANALTRAFPDIAAVRAIIVGDFGLLVGIGSVLFSQAHHNPDLADEMPCCTTRSASLVRNRCNSERTRRKESMTPHSCRRESEDREPTNRPLVICLHAQCLHTRHTEHGSGSGRRCRRLDPRSDGRGWLRTCVGAPAE